MWPKLRYVLWWCRFAGPELKRTNSVPVHSFPPVILLHPPALFVPCLPFTSFPFIRSLTIHKDRHLQPFSYLMSSILLPFPSRLHLFMRIVVADSNLNRASLKLCSHSTGSNVYVHASSSIFALTIPLSEPILLLNYAVEERSRVFQPPQKGLRCPSHRERRKSPSAPAIVIRYQYTYHYSSILIDSRFQNTCS